jgi:hypothetical protein
VVVDRGRTFIGAFSTKERAASWIEGGYGGDRVLYTALDDPDFSEQVWPPDASRSSGVIALLFEKLTNPERVALTLRIHKLIAAGREDWKCEQADDMTKIKIYCDISRARAVLREGWGERLRCSSERAAEEMDPAMWAELKTAIGITHTTWASLESKLLDVREARVW